MFNAADGTLAFSLGSRGTGDGHFIRPSSAAFSGPLPAPMMPGMLAVADSPTNRIKVFYPDGTFAYEIGGVAGDTDRHLQRPQDAAFSPDGTLIATTKHVTARIQVFYASANDTLYDAFGMNGSGPADIDTAGRITYSPDGKRIAVTDHRNERIQVFNTGNARLAFSIDGQASDMAYSQPDGKSIVVLPSRDERAASPHNATIRVFHAGNGTFDYAFGTRGNGTEELLRPTSIASSPDGRWIAVADSGLGRIHVYHAANHTYAFAFGTNGTGEGQFGPRIMDIEYSTDSTRIAAADRENKRILVFQYDGNYVGQINSSSSGVHLEIPKSVSFAPPGANDATPPMPRVRPEPLPLPPTLPGMLVVADSRMHRVQAFDADGAHAFTFGGYGSATGKFSDANNVAYSPDGTQIAVADSNNRRIQVFSIGADGVDFAFKFGTRGTGEGEFGWPNSAAYSPDGTQIAVADSGRNRIHVFNVGADSASFAFEFGSGGNATGQFDRPNSAAYSPDGTQIAVADTKNHRIQVFDVGADSASFAFEFGTGGTGEGQFKHPARLGYSPDGTRMVVADRGNNRIQVFDVGADSASFAFEFGTGGTGEGQFNDPRSAAYSPDGEWIAVADTFNHRIQIFHANGTFAGGIGLSYDAHFRKPNDMAFAPLPPPSPLPPGAIAVVERAANQVQVFHPNGTLAFEFGTNGTGPGQFTQPVSAAFAPDGSRIAVADMHNHRVQVFDAAGDFAFKVGGLARGNGDRQFHYPASVAYSPDGTRIAVADSNNHRVQVLNATNGAYISTFNGFNTPRSAAYSPDGEWIAVADAYNNRVLVINATSGVTIATYGSLGSVGTGDGQFNSPRYVAWSPDGERIAAVDRNNHRIQLLDAESAAFVGRFGGPSSGAALGQFNNPTGVAYSPDGTLLAVADMRNNRVQVLYAANGTASGALGSAGLLAGQFNGPSSVAFVPLPPPLPIHLAVADSLNNRIQIFDAATGEFVLKFGQQGTANGSFSYPTSVDYSPDGTRIAVADYRNHRIQIFDAATGEFALTFGQYGSIENGSFNHPTSVAYSNDGRIAVVDHRNHRIQVFDAATGEFVLKFGEYGRAGNGSLAHPTSVDYSPDGTRIAVADYENNRTQVFDAATGEFVLEFGQSGRATEGSFIYPASIAYSPDGKRIAVAEQGHHNIQVFNAATGEFKFEFGQMGRIAGGSFTYPSSVAYSPDGERIAAGDHRNHRIQIFDAATGEFALTFGQYGSIENGSFRLPSSIAYSPLP